MTDSSDKPRTPPRPGKSTGRRRAEGTSRTRSPRRENFALHRHQARVIALQIIYEVDVTTHELPDVMERTLHDPEEVVLPAVAGYAEKLVNGVTEHMVTIDRYIAAAAPAFPVPQLPSVDRNVLRLAVYELLYEPEVPFKAAINEAVELAKRYGGMNSSRFVNGVLRTVTTQIDQERAAAATHHGEGAPESST
ncbi:MAG TPA: transcription antitermination factor NusB [Thermomicrobiales bacterium]|nr:transcription antitermination factor NusB [Thermomicrobiales bacterium]